MEVEEVEEQSTQEYVPDPVILPNNIEDDVIAEEAPADDEEAIQERESSPALSGGREEPSKKRPHLESSGDEDEGKLCPICLDNWTNTGEHRVCSLKCGHLFGLKCVKRWLATQPKKACPTCKKKVYKTDIRNIYAKKLIAVDTSEVDTLKMEIESLTQEKNRLQLDLTKSVCREHMQTQQIEQLKKQIVILTDRLETKRIVAQSQSSSSTSKSVVTGKVNVNVSMYMDKAVEICKSSGCRVVDVSVPLDLIVASVKSPNNLFAGYGIRKINISEYKPNTFIPLHVDPVRDISFHPQNQLILTVSLDKTFKLVNTNTNNALFSVNCDTPLWSCCWDSDNNNTIYVGSQQGMVLKYDIRNTSAAAETLTTPGDYSPVVSLASIPACAGDAIACGGVVSCKLNNVWVFENNASAYPFPLPLFGPFISMRYQRHTRQLLVSARPNARTPHARHVVCNLSKGGSDGRVGCDVVHVFNSGSVQKLMSRSCFVSGKQEYVAAHDECFKKVRLWSVNTGDLVCSVPAHEPVLDMCGLQNGAGSYLVSVTEKKLEFFKFSE